MDKAIQEAAEAGTAILKKSQMSLDFSPHDHHIAYTRIAVGGTLSRIKAKGIPVHHSAPAPSSRQEGTTMPNDDHTTFTGKRVNSYCPRCEVTAIMDYKTDRHDNGHSESYKECRNCGTKVTVNKRVTKQKIAQQERTARANVLIEEMMAETPSPFHAAPTIPKMAALVAANNLDYNEFETTEGTCDACGKDRDVRTVHDADNGGDTLYGQVCDDCLEEAHRTAPAEPEPEDEGMARIAQGEWPHTAAFYKTRQEIGQTFDDAFSVDEYPGLSHILGSDWNFNNGGGRETPARYYEKALERLRSKYPMDQDQLTWEKRQFRTNADITQALDEYRAGHGVDITTEAGIMKRIDQLRAEKAPIEAEMRSIPPDTRVIEEMDRHSAASRKMNAIHTEMERLSNLIYTI